MEDVVISSLHHKTWCFVVDLYRVATVHGGIPVASSAAQTSAGWPGTKKPRGRKLNGKLVFLVFSFFRHQKKRDGLPPKSVESESNMLPCGYRGAQNLQDGMDNSILSSPKPKVYAVKKTKRQKDKKGVVPRSVGYQGPDHRGLDPRIPQNHRPRGSPEERIEDGRAVTGQLCMGGQS